MGDPMGDPIGDPMGEQAGELASESILVTSAADRDRIRRPLLVLGLAIFTGRGGRLGLERDNNRLDEPTARLARGEPAGDASIADVGRVVIIRPEGGVGILTGGGRRLNNRDPVLGRLEEGAVDSPRERSALVWVVLTLCL